MAFFAEGPVGTRAPFVLGLLPQGAFSRPDALRGRARQAGGAPACLPRLCVLAGTAAHSALGEWPLAARAGAPAPHCPRHGRLGFSAPFTSLAETADGAGGGAHCRRPTVQGLRLPWVPGPPRAAVVRGHCL